MPRSRRRKGAKQTMREMHRRELQAHVVPRRYYDPGANPRPHSAKHPPPSTQQRRPNYQRGG